MNVRRELSRKGHGFFVERHGWTYLLIAFLTCAAAVYVLSQREVALAPEDARPHTPPGSELKISLPPRQITYEVTSSTNSPITVSYLDEHNQTHLFSGQGPWRTSVTATDAAPPAGVTALTNNGAVTCRITIDGKVVDEQTQSGGTPSVSCNPSLNALQQFQQ
ncbi:MAG: MmpS family transport accessory protein [Segniliparus sp.]|uniref:MmpS family transport accessory protein n=1 Tax=Segniliparus sp. TaxID=2804064 RepID=UPI003F3927CC